MYRTLYLRLQSINIRGLIGLLKYILQSYVFVQGYKRKKEFIITQMPLSTTKTEFWRLIEEHGVHIIVMMNNESEAKVKNIYA